MLRRKVNSLGNPRSQSWRRKEGYGGKDLQKSNVLSLEWRSEGCNVKMFCTHIYQKTSINTIILGNAHITKPSYLKL